MVSTTLMCGACTPSTDPGFTLSKANRHSGSVPVPTRPKPLKAALEPRGSRGWA